MEKVTGADFKSATAEDNKKLFIETYGCQMNELDTEIMAGQLHKKGLTPSQDEENADLLIFNTCSIRDLAERKLIAQQQNTAAIDVSTAEALVSERARIDLELELTARRDEAEAEYLKKHQEAVATTQKYLDDANAQLALALTRVNAARLEAETLEAAARSMTKSVTEAARAKAEAAIAAAEAESRTILAEASRNATLTVREAENRLRKIQTERESIASYLINLQALVDHAAKAEKESE